MFCEWLIQDLLSIQVLVIFTQLSAYGGLDHVDQLMYYILDLSAIPLLDHLT